MEPYPGMNLNIPYGEENAGIIYSGSQMYGIPETSWTPTNFKGVYSVRDHIALFPRDIYATSTTPFYVYQQNYPNPTIGYTIYDRGIFVNGSNLMYMLCGQRRQSTGTPVFIDLYGYTDGSFVYLWNNSTSELLRPNANFGTINNKIIVPASLFYSDISTADERSYKVRGLFQQVPGPDNIDPNSPGGASGSAGGDGTFNDISMPVPTPSVDVLESVSAINTKMVSIYSPTSDQLNLLSSYLWTNASDIFENINKWFANPMDYIISLQAMPIEPETGPAEAINIGSITTTVKMPPCLSQWAEFNCGAITVEKYWGSAFDYAPYTKMQLFIPFVGSVEISADEAMGNDVGLVYNIDLLSGQAIAMVTINGDVRYQYSGDCAISIPMTGADWSRLYSAVSGTVGAVAAGGIATALAGKGAGISAAIAAQHATAALGSGAENSNQKFLDATAQANMYRSYARGLKASAAIGAANSTIQQITNGKVAIQRSGGISGVAGMLGVLTPYLLIEYPSQSLAENYKHYHGYPCNINTTLGDLSGYTEVEKIIAGGIPGTDEEFSEILEALQEGVYL